MNYSFSDKLANLRPSAIREIFKSLTDPSIISFAAGNPSPESFPVEALAALAADIFRTQSTAALQYNITEGYPPLREAVAARQSSASGVTLTQPSLSRADSRASSLPARRFATRAMSSSARSRALSAR